MTYKALASTLKVLSDASRLEILDILSCGERCACDLLEHFQFSQPTLSHHMKTLVDQGFVTTFKDGNKRMYQLNHDKLKEIDDHLSSLNPSQEACICNTVKRGACQ